MSEGLKRKTLFRIALATEGISAAEFGRRHGVTRAAVYRVLSGDMTSKPLSDAINGYIQERLRKAKIKVGRSCG